MIPASFAPPLTDAISFPQATVESFDKATKMYTVNFEDGDPTGREQPFNLVAFDRKPAEGDVAVGSDVFFPQVLCLLLQIACIA